MSVRNIILITILCFLFIGGAYFLVAGGNKPEVKVTTYSTNDKKKPAVEVKTLIDLGTIKVSNQKNQLRLKMSAQNRFKYLICLQVVTVHGQLIYREPS
jgi:hypothetical protein